MLVFRRCLTLSAGVLFYLSLGTPGLTQPVTSLDKSKTKSDSPLETVSETEAPFPALSLEKESRPTKNSPIVSESSEIAAYPSQETKPQNLQVEVIDLKIANFPPKPEKISPALEEGITNPSQPEQISSDQEAVITAQSEKEQLQYSLPSTDTNTDLFSPSEETTETPSEESPSPSELSKTEKLDPSPNPLLFPTQQEEVKIDNANAITLEEAIELSRRNNRDLQVAALNLEKSRQAYKEAFAELYPNLATEFNFSHSDSASAELQSRRVDGGVFDGVDVFGNSRETKSTPYSGLIELSYDVYTGGRRGAAIRAAAEQVKLQELELEKLYEQNRFDVTTSYYRLQNADAQVAIQQAAVQDATQSLRDAELLEQAGLGTKFDVLTAQVQLANSNQDLTLAISEQRVARRELVELLSLGQKVEVIAADPIETAGSWELSLEESIVMAYKNRAELEQNLVQRNIDQERQTIEMAALKPQISIFANYNFLGDLFDNLRPADGYQFGARLRWDLFDGGAAKARQQQAKIDVKIDETQFADQRNKIRLEVETAYYNLEANQENIGTATIAVQLAEESLRLARLRFQAGVGTQTDVINSQTDLTTARGNLLRAIIDYNQSLNALQRAVSNLPDQQLFDLP